MKELRSKHATFATILKYIHANALACDFLLQTELSIETRMSLEKTKQGTRVYSNIIYIGVCSIQDDEEAAAKEKAIRNT